MPANIDSFVRRSGTAEPWWGVGNTIRPGASLDEQLRAAGLDWTVETSPVYYRAGDTAKIAQDKSVLYRSDTGTALSVMSTQYQPVQPRECLQLFHDLADHVQAALNTAGGLRGGQIIWGLADTGREFTLGTNDRTKLYLLVSTSHDGTQATKIGPTAVRVVCENTNRLAVRGGGLLSINHRNAINWDRVREWVESGYRSFDHYSLAAQTLADTEISAAESADLITRIIAPEWDRKSPPPRKLTRLADIVAHGVGQDGTGPTMWRVWNGVTRYADHDKQAHSADSRMVSAWFGQGAALKQGAWDLLLNQCVEQHGRKELVPIMAN